MYRGRKGYMIEYLDKDNNLKSDYTEMKYNPDGTVKMGMNESVKMKTMSQLCEGIMDDLDVQQANSSAVLANATKMDKRPIDDYPYFFMFIMWNDHKLYKERQKMKKDVMAFLEQFQYIKEYSDIVFDKDPGDTTFSFGFEHNIRTVSQFYRMFTGMISYMRRYITNKDYEFIVKDVVADKELCRMNNDDVELFRNIQLNRSLGNDKEEADNQMGYFQETCVNLLKLSWKEVAEQMSRLFNVRFEFYDKSDDDDNLVINKVFLNEKKQLKSMKQLCEGILDDLEAQQSNSSAVIANATKMDERSAEDYPYKMMFIMWKEHKLYKERQKVKKDVILYLQQNPLITAFSEVKFDVDRDADDTTLYLGFEHKIRTVGQFYRLFIGMVGYLRKHMNIVNYEFIVRDNAEEQDLCRIDQEDFEIFKLLQTERRVEDYKKSLQRLKWFIQSCEEFLDISDAAAMKQTEHLFGVRFEKDPKYDIIDRMYLFDAVQDDATNES